MIEPAQAEQIEWRCSECGEEYFIHPAYLDNHVCQPRVHGPPQVAYYFYRLKEDDFVTEFCVANHNDPTQTVHTLAPDGTEQPWERREEGDLLVFHPPDGYAGAQGLLWKYNRLLQIGKDAPREVLEREALRNRISL